MSAFYNEIDPFAAQTLRNLIAAGHIAPGVVDERSIEDIKPEELYAYTQCHFFAGVGVWSYALRLAGWPDDRRVWTGSCPCQPFSAAGAGAGFADERHLWPAFHHLIAQCKPARILGEQVASSAVDAWIDLVHADLEALGYAFGSVPFPSAGVGAPHIRDRNYWVAHDVGAGQRALAGKRGGAWGSYGAAIDARAPGGSGGLEHAKSGGWEGQSVRAGGAGSAIGIAKRGDLGGLADADGEGWRDRRQFEGGRNVRAGSAPTERGTGGQGVEGLCTVGDPGPTNGFWRDADWLGCRDGKWRPVEPGTFPLANGATARVGRLRAYGNAINAEAARVFVQAVMESIS